MTTEEPEPVGGHGVDERSYTSLAVLRAHHRDIKRRLKDGFDDRTDILLWQHEVAAKTIGQMPDRWHTKFVKDRWLTAALLADPLDRAALSSSPPNDQAARRQRESIVQDDLLPAFLAAIKEFRSLAVEYVEDTDRPVRMGRQRFLALRPRLDELVRDQRAVLEWALGCTDTQDRPAIDSRDIAREWASEVIYATRGNIGPRFTRDVTALSSEWLSALRNPGGITLMVLLSTDILPVLNETIRQEVGRSKEVQEEERKGQRVDPRPTEAY